MRQGGLTLVGRMRAGGRGTAQKLTATADVVNNLHLALARRTADSRLATHLRAAPLDFHSEVQNAELVGFQRRWHRQLASGCAARAHRDKNLEWRFLHPTFAKSSGT